jgi:hypothetical protein
MKNTITKTQKFTIRTDEDTAILLRHSYELFRQKCLLEGNPIESLNKYICKILGRGIETMETAA